MNLDQYRAAVVAAVGCPFCGARPGDPCLNTYGTTNPVRKSAGYVHDDRSLTYADSLERDRCEGFTTAPSGRTLRCRRRIHPRRQPEPISLDFLTETPSWTPDCYHVSDPYDGDEQTRYMIWLDEQ